MGKVSAAVMASTLALSTVAMQLKSLQAITGTRENPLRRALYRAICLTA